MRQPRAHVNAPPVPRKIQPLWLAGLALAAHVGIALWLGIGHPTSALEPLETLPLGDLLRGRATWYGAELHGNATASGEPFDMYGLTAAHRTLPLGSRARVTNLANGREVVVRINDRGPGRDGVMIDLSYAAAQAIGLQGSGPVEVEPLR
jgi:rare lipoprotein A